MDVHNRPTAGPTTPTGSTSSTVSSMFKKK